jgi:uncharacterized protein YecT (DUF1311 family)
MHREGTLPKRSTNAGLVIFVFMTFAAMAGAGPFAAEGADVTAMRQEYETADAELNRVYRQVRRALPPEQRAELRQDELAWIDYKELVCGFQREISDKDDPATDRAYWECLRDMTRERIPYLRAWTGEGVSSGLAGEYSDGLGGSLYLKAAGDQRFTFEMMVVRGPTAHIGEVRGSLFVDRQKAVFRETEDCPDPAGDCCRLTFTFSGRRVKIDEDHCGYLRGVRAYFNGLYLKVK